jgi:hypothetical protein
MEASATGQEASQAPARKVVRSFFTKKLERKFEEKELQIPQKLINLLDVPFEEFTPRDRELYESNLKPLAFVFAEHLMEVYEVMGRPRRGWEEMLDRLKDSPIKVMASLVLHEDEKVQSMEDFPVEEEEVPEASSGKTKINVRPYRDRDRNKERWWEKKIF